LNFTSNLYTVTFFNGSLVIFNEVAQRSYLPSLIERDRLLEANSKMAASDSVVEQIGFSVGGFIVQLASAIASSVVQTVTFFVSGLFRVYWYWPYKNQNHNLRTLTENDPTSGAKYSIGTGL
jgi:hypothetical protein